MNRPKNKRKARPQRAKRLSRTRKPEHLSSSEWQAGLRRQFGREQIYGLTNIGEHRFFSDFEVLSDSGATYLVSIRGSTPGDNRCTCPDFRTNLLGTCKHVEFVLFMLEARRGAKKAFATGYLPPFSEVYLRYGAEHEIRFRPGSECTPALKRRARNVFDQEAQWKLKPDSLDALERFLAAARRSRHEVRWREDIPEFIDRARRDRQRRETLATAFPEGARSPALASILNLELYPYQCEGVWFAANAGRAIIADDMGLGKTIQAIAVAEIMFRHLGAERVLIVCPTSLRHQWQEEFEYLTSRRVGQIMGSPKHRAAAYIAPEAVKVLSYDTARRDIDMINAWQPDLVIADEAQRIKNWNTRIAQAMKQVKSTAALILTGTPIENRLTELVSIVQFIDQHRLGPTWQFLERHQERDEAGQVLGYQRLDEIAHTLQPILIRRTKEAVLNQLPPRRDKLFLVPLAPAQIQFHQEYAETVARIVAQWRKRGALTDTEQKRLMAALQNMRMVCDSTYLIDTGQDKGNKIAEVMRVIDDLLRHPSNRIVLFSQWLRAHELLKRQLDSRSIGYVFFHGGVPSKQRVSLIRQFREDPDCRLFLSTDVGGTGLNLQHATVVINLDMPWNPAILEQRIGRVHRIGQHRPVQVMNFVAEASIEHRLLGLLDFKRSLASGVLDGGQREISLGGTRLTRFMKDVENVTGARQHREATDSLQRGGDESPGSTARQTPDDSGTEASITASPETRSAVQSSGRSAAEANPWASLLQLGQALLAEISAADVQGNRVNGVVRRDPETGDRYLHLPAPKPEAVGKLVAALGELFESRKG